MRFWFISDSHTKHRLITVPTDVDAVIFGGDSSSSKDLETNKKEVLDFIDWFKTLNIKYKIMIAGNHDTSLGEHLIKMSDYDNIIYLEHELIMINGIRIFGSPYTPNFGSNWAFNVQRGMLSKYWNKIPDKLDILVTHGPPNGILDLTQHDSRPGAKGNEYFQCGCKELLERVKVIKPKYHIFGHIHTEKNCNNSGVLKLTGYKTTFINSSVCGYERITVDSVDEKIKHLINSGIIIDYDNNSV